MYSRKKTKTKTKPPVFPTVRSMMYPVVVRKGGGNDGMGGVRD